MLPLTKGKMIKILEKRGIRYGDKNGSDVKLSHLKDSQVASLYFQYCKD